MAERYTAKGLGEALFDLRASGSPEVFFQKRLELETKFFSGPGLPRWFLGLYYRRKELVVHCYNKSIAEFTFRFQGSESLNAIYKRLIIDRKIPMSRVPKEIDRYFAKRRLGEAEDFVRIKYYKDTHSSWFYLWDSQRRVG